MWMAIGIIGALGFLVAIIGTLIMAIKKNPVWKKWLAAMGVSLVMFIVGVANDNSTPNTSVPSSNVTDNPSISTTKIAEPQTDTTFKDGMYKVGSDIPAGEYVLISNDQAYFAITSDSSGNLSSILANDMFNKRSIISVSDGQYLELKSCKAYPAAEAPAVDKSGNTLAEGMYKVGVDLPSGEYKVETANDGYLEVSSNSTHSMDSIITNDMFSGSKYITVNDGQYIKLNNAQLYLQ